MRAELIREGLRVKHALNPRLTGTVYRLGGGDFQRRMRVEASDCPACKKAMEGRIWGDTYPPIPDRTCPRHAAASADAFGWCMVEWDVRKKVAIPMAPDMLEPEIDLHI